MKLVYIHGNRATGNSFNFIRGQITGFDEIVLEYDSGAGFYENHAHMLKCIEGHDNLFFIAHSLGGLHAFHLANAIGNRAVGGMTMSTPYGGCKIAEMFVYFWPTSKVMQDIRPRSKPITQGSSISLNVPWTNLVSTVGSSPFLVVANDGVVTQFSMRHRRDIELIDIPCNHFEILLHPETIMALQNKINAIQAAQTVNAMTTSELLSA